MARFRPPKKPGSGGIGGGVATSCLPTATTAAVATATTGCYTSTYSTTISSLCYKDCPSSYSSASFKKEDGNECFYCANENRSAKLQSGVWKCYLSTSSSQYSDGVTLSRTTSNGYAVSKACASGYTQDGTT